MIRKPWNLAVLFAFVVTAGLSLPDTAIADASIVDRELVSKTRVGRASFAFTYRLVLSVDGPALDGVRVFVRCDAPGTTIIADGNQDVVQFGDVPGNQSTTSTDTFTLIQNRRVAFDPGCLDYDIGFDETLVLSGLATDMPLSNATITATVLRPDSGRPVIIDSGRPVIENFTTIADDQGNYALEFPVLHQDDFVTMTATGSGEQSDATLTSTIGSVGALHTVGAEGSIVVGNDTVGGLTITHITTALDELVRRLNDGVPPATDAELAALQAQVDGAELVILATLIKAIVDNPNVPLPPGFGNTLELIQDEAAAEAYAIEVQQTFPDEWAAALAEITSTIGLGYSPDEVPGIFYTAMQSERPQIFGAFMFDLNDQGGGTVAELIGSSNVIWSLDPDGNIVVDLIDPPSYETSEVLLNPFRIVRVLNFTDRLTIIRIADNASTDSVFVLATLRKTFPDEPNMPDEISETQPNPNAVFLAFGEDAIVPIDPADLAGERIAAWYYNSDNGVVQFAADDTLGADFLNFNSDGTGITNRRQLAFGWSIDSSGALILTFDNGDSDRYLKFNDDGLVTRAIVIGSLVGRNPLAYRTEMIASDGNTGFNSANIVNEEWGFAFGGAFYRFYPNGTGCRPRDDLMSGRPLDWQLLPGGILDFIRFNTAGSTPTVRRTWESIALTTGTLGDRHWIIENLDFDRTVLDTWPAMDPLINLGRITAVEDFGDISNQPDPCG